MRSLAIKNLATKKLAAALSLSTALALAAPAWAQQADTDMMPTASASFVDGTGETVGAATLTQTDDGVMIEGSVSGLSEGEHGFHIHETGACAPDEDFETAGGHFNPTAMMHGLENPEGPHAGDMENQTASAEGELAFSVTNDRVSLVEGEQGYLLDDDGSALMVHSGPDDYVTDPGGDAGDRVACAVIEAAM